MRRWGPHIALLVAVPLLSGCFNASVRDWVAGKYEKRTDEGPARVYHANGVPSAVAKEIADARPPAERRVTTSGVFLRYRSDMVGVLPDAAGGSRVLITNERNGYAYFFPYIGGYWGTYSGTGDTFRGGGPGGGK